MQKQRYHELRVWQRADEFVQTVYLHTKNFPYDERFGVTSQLRRAAVSIVLNIVEGQARGTTKDFIRFLMMSRGSIAESAYLLELSSKLKYLSEKEFTVLESKCTQTSYLLQQLITSLTIKDSKP